MRYFTRYLALILVLVIIGCRQNADTASYEVADQTVYNNLKKEEGAEGIIERKLIKEGRIEFETSDLQSTRKVILEAVTKYKAYISSDRESKYTGRTSHTIIIRVPAADFDNLLNETTRGVKRFDSKEVNVKDVTEEFLDIQIRLKTKKEFEQRYIALLKQAKTVSEILEIEKQIGELRSEIESIEGRMKYLEDRVSLSALTITFYESIPEQTAFGQKFKNGFRNGFDNLIWFFVGIVNLWPFILIIAALIIAFRVYKKKRKNKNI
ncbi:DUF4349 domain-containing protein [Gynurincola endophyticus]|uniref:DUF4349 domain-containing protein n=1 Tax=Gynurincola endophyticus TaxID=2479004 RepID=UPI00131574D6|nr:DUF4349 domain-containing protein [Gynurincola endophyticus]